MARYEDRDRAIELRRQGMSYSQIKELLNVSKSSLSLWLRKYPLSEDRLRELRDKNEKRIENFRNTMKRKRDIRMSEIYKHAERDIGSMGKRDLFISGLMLYWAEGSKSRTSYLGLTNTNPAILKLFIKWLQLMRVDLSRLKIQIQIYEDMNPKEKVGYWSQELGVSTSQFRKPYIKQSSYKRINYKGGFANGTCTVIYDNKRLAEYVSMALQYIAKLYS